MLDLHTHILPGMDDGSKSPERSISMLRREKTQGIDRVVLTPHFYPDREAPDHFLKRRGKAMLALQQAADGKQKLPELILGAEVAYFAGISRVEDIEDLCIGGTRAMLIEMPFCRWNSNIIDELIYLKDCRGVRPILAHVERYMKLQPPGMIRQMRQMGIWMQVSSSFFQNWQTSRKTLRMLKKGTIQFLGSDCHDLKRRPPDMDGAISRIEKRLGEDALEYLEHMERRLLKGE